MSEAVATLSAGVFSVSAIRISAARVVKEKAHRRPITEPIRKQPVQLYIIGYKVLSAVLCADINSKRYKPYRHRLVAVSAEIFHRDTAFLLHCVKKHSRYIAVKRLRDIVVLECEKFIVRR